MMPTLESDAPTVQPEADAQLPVVPEAQTQPDGGGTPPEGPLQTAAPGEEANDGSHDKIPTLQQVAVNDRFDAMVAEEGAATASAEAHIASQLSDIPVPTVEAAAPVSQAPAIESAPADPAVDATFAEMTSQLPDVNAVGEHIATAVETGQVDPATLATEQGPNYLPSPSTEQTLPPTTPPPTVPLTPPTAAV